MRLENEGFKKRTSEISWKSSITVAQLPKMDVAIVRLDAAIRMYGPVHNTCWASSSYT